MTFLFFLLDVTFYNLTPFKTDFLLHIFSEKKENKALFFLTLLWIDFVLKANLKFFILYFLLFWLNRFFKLPDTHLSYTIKRFILNYIFYKIGVLVLFHTFFLDFWGFFITFLFLIISHKS